MDICSIINPLSLISGPPCPQRLHSHTAPDHHPARLRRSEVKLLLCRLHCGSSASSSMAQHPLPTPASSRSGMSKQKRAADPLTEGQGESRISSRMTEDTQNSKPHLPHFPRLPCPGYCSATVPHCKTLFRHSQAAPLLLQAAKGPCPLL